MDVYHTTHDWNGPDRLSYAIVTAVAAIRGVEPTTLPPLGVVCDTDALDRFFADSRESGRAEDRLSLRYGGCRVTVHRNGHVILEPPAKA